MDGFMLFDSEQDAQTALGKLNTNGIVVRLNFTYADGSTASKWAINRIVMGENRDGSDMAVEWLFENGTWGQ